MLITKYGMIEMFLVCIKIIIILDIQHGVYVIEFSDRFWHILTENCVFLETKDEK